MPIDQAWVERLSQMPDLADRDTLTVDGVELVLPVAGHPKVREKQWQPRVSDDLLPDSPNADSPEKITFELVDRLTRPDEQGNIREVFEGDLAPLEPIFMFKTRQRLVAPVAFHVLPAKSSVKVRSRAFTHRTFLLLMRDGDGRLDTDLVRAFVQQFRRPLGDLDLAQQAVLERLVPGWAPGDAFGDYDPQSPQAIVPFVEPAAELFRADVRTLIDARLPQADFFRYANQLIALHFGLYQPRLAAHLNPAMDALRDELAAADSRTVEEVEAIERGRDPRFRFEGSLRTRAPSGGNWRSIRRDDPERLSFAEMERGLVELHFNLNLFNRLRLLTSRWLAAQEYDASSIVELVRTPSSLMGMLQFYPDYRRFIERALEAFAVRFTYNQLQLSSRKSALDEIRSARSGLDALRSLVIRYNMESAHRANQSRAWKQGGQVVRRLLNMGEMGLVQARGRGGVFFELGSGMLPLLLLLLVRRGDPSREKVSIDDFRTRLEAYGLKFSGSEWPLLLDRLKAMGLYERYSDAGSASYVRGLWTARAAEGR